MFDDHSCTKSLQLVIIIGAMFTASLLLSSGMVVSQATSDLAVDAQPTAIIKSRFMLWDINDKSLDKSFNIILLSWSNYSNTYLIQIDAKYFNGTFYQYHQLNFTYTNISKILYLSISINNKTVLHATNIKLMSGITQSRIDTIQEPYKISFLPFELTRLEWNLVFSGIVGVLISLPVAYFTIKYYRKHRGAQVM